MWFLHGVIALGGMLVTDKLPNILEFLLVLIFPFLICGTGALKSYNVSSWVGICRICHAGKLTAVSEILHRSHVYYATCLFLLRNLAS